MKPCLIKRRENHSPSPEQMLRQNKSYTINTVKPMASFKIKFRPSKVAGREGTIYYQLVHARKIRQLHTPYRIFPSEWDEHRSVIVISRPSERYPHLLSLRERVGHDLERLRRISLSLENSGVPFSADDIADEFRRYVRDYSLFNYMEGLIGKLRETGRIRTSETYNATLNSIRKFREGEDILLDCITTDLMERYETWLRSRGNSSNTISFYTRILRAVYHRAVEADVIENRNPFRRVYTGVDKTVKRALPIRMIKTIRCLDLSGEPVLDYARDMFILSFMLRGMSFIDMAFLRKTDLSGGYVSYRRRKTGQRLMVEWTREMQAILDKYPDNESCYLLPVIKREGVNERTVFHNACYRINRALKIIAKRVGVKIPLTLYVARHSWASAAKTKGIPVSVISEGMGHDSETTTRIYLASLDTSVVDRANAVIIKSIK